MRRGRVFITYINSMFMKRIILLVVAFLSLTPAVMAGDKNKKAKKTAQAAEADTTEIHWLSLDDVQVAMKKEPKKVWFDIYTDWCGWCKVMDKKTFSNKDVIRYMNKNFYAVRLNAEQKDTIRFMGKSYGFVPQYRANMFAVELLKGQMSYPTGVVLEPNFQNPIAIPGYQDVTSMEKILKYIGEDIYKTKKFPEYEKEFTPTWAGSASPGQESMAPAGH